MIGNERPRSRQLFGPLSRLVSIALLAALVVVLVIGYYRYEIRQVRARETAEIATRERRIEILQKALRLFRPVLRSGFNAQVPSEYQRSFPDAAHYEIASLERFDQQFGQDDAFAARSFSLYGKGAREQWEGEVVDVTTSPSLGSSRVELRSPDAKKKYLVEFTSPDAAQLLALNQGDRVAIAGRVSKAEFPLILVGERLRLLTDP